MTSHSYFSLIYIKTNRFSEEKFCVGIIANNEGVPYFGYSKSKLNIALSFCNPNLTKAIKYSFGLLANDVNKIINGEEAMSLFDKPYSKQILEKLTLKKRGLVQYSDLFDVNQSFDFFKLYKKYVGEEWVNEKKDVKKKDSFKKRFYRYVESKRKFDKFQKKSKLLPKDYSSIHVPLAVDLIHKDKAYLVFQTIDFTASITSIQNSLNKFRLLRQSLSQNSDLEGLSKGRYYLVYESPKDSTKRELVQKINKNAIGFELIRLSEMSDKL